MIRYYSAFSENYNPLNARKIYGKDAKKSMEKTQKNLCKGRKKIYGNAGRTGFVKKRPLFSEGPLGFPYLDAFAARIASVSMGVTLNRSPQMP